MDRVESLIRRSGDWMCLLDDRLLEAVAALGPISVQALASRRGLNAPVRVISTRLRLLADVGLVAPLGDLPGRTWEITTWGVRYLQGELDAELLYPGRRSWPAVVSSKSVIRS